MVFGRNADTAQRESVTPQIQLLNGWCKMTVHQNVYRAVRFYVGKRKNEG